MPNLLRMVAWIALVLVNRCALAATELKGKVVQTADNSVKVQLDAELAPTIGEPAEIYFEIPGIADVASIARCWPPVASWRAWVHWNSPAANASRSMRPNTR